MTRQPTEAELNFINSHLAEKPMMPEQCIMIDAALANDMMTSCYFYHIGTSSLFLFAQDLEEKMIPCNAMHKRDIPLGAWLPGKIITVASPPEGALPGKNYQLQAPLYMPKDLTVNGYNTNELAKAHECGVLKDVSISWIGNKQTKLICSVCGEDIRNYEKCSHMPGQEYEGKVCTFAVEMAHLSNVALVDDGGLPGAMFLSSGEMKILVKDGKPDWSDIKKLSSRSKGEIRNRPCGRIRSPGNPTGEGDCPYNGYRKINSTGNRSCQSDRSVY